MLKQKSVIFNLLAENLSEQFSTSQGWCHLFIVFSEFALSPPATLSWMCWCKCETQDQASSGSASCRVFSSARHSAVVRRNMAGIFFQAKNQGCFLLGCINSNRCPTVVDTKCYTNIILYASCISACLHFQTLPTCC